MSEETWRLPKIGEQVRTPDGIVATVIWVATEYGQPDAYTGVDDGSGHGGVFCADELELLEDAP